MAANKPERRHSESGLRQEETLAQFIGVREVRIRRIPHDVLLAVTTLATLGVLGVVAHKNGPWYVAFAAVLVFGGYMLWTIYEKNREGEGPAESGASAERTGTNG